MPKEKEAYRANLERIKQMFPEKEVLTVSDVAKFCPCDKATAKKRYPFDQYNTISVATLASCLSK